MGRAGFAVGVPKDRELGVPKDDWTWCAGAGAGAVVAADAVWPNENELLVVAGAPNDKEPPADGAAPVY